MKEFKEVLTLIALLFMCYAFAACQKEISYERKCGKVVYKAQEKNYLVVYPDGSEQWVNQDLIVGQQYCK